MSPETEKTLRLAFLIGLLTWGVYTVIAYWSVGYHEAVFLSDALIGSVRGACPANGVWCLGLHTLLPSIGNFIARSSFYLWYIVASAIIYGVLLFVGYMQTGKWVLRLNMTPLKMILWFVLSVWLFFTMISIGDNQGQPYNQLYKPSSATFENADPTTLTALLKDYNDLQDRGCLIPVPGAPAELGVANVSYGCIQLSFFTRVLSQFLILLGYLLAFLTLGRFLLRLLKLPPEDLHGEAMFSVAIGACGMIVILWTAAVAHLYTQLAGWLILVAVLGLLWKDAWYWLRSAWERRFVFEESPYSGSVLLGWLLLSYLAFNFLSVVRPFPIGWDDLGVYMNDPRLLVSYGFAIPRLAAFQWEYLTGLGFLLFGYDVPFGATNALLINWMAGAFALLAVYVFGRRFLGRLGGILAALLYYTLPLVGHFSFADMKVDNAVFTMGALGMLGVWCYLFPNAEGTEGTDGAEVKRDLRWLIVGGVLLGFGFAMKPTVIMAVMATLAVLVGALVQPVGFLGAAFFAWAVFTKEGTFNVANVASRVYGNPEVLSKVWVLAACLIAGVVLIGYAVHKHRKSVRPALIAVGVFLLSVTAAVSPWIIRNNILRGRHIPGIVLTAPNNLSVNFIVSKDADEPPAGQKVRRLPDELMVDMQSAACSTSTSKKEELDRYWGYGEGWGHYVTLPWRTVMNADSFGYYVTTMPALLLLPLLLLLPAFWKKENRWLRWLFAATLFIVVQWMFMANGVPWYGISMFLGLAVGISALFIRAPDRWTKWAMGVLIFFSLLSNFSHRFWQAEQQRNLYAYSIGVVSAAAMQERTIPHYNDVRDMVMQRNASVADRPYTYRMGTFIPYFIPRNLEVIPVADHQLDYFGCLNAEHDPALTVKRLKALGFNGIIFDTNTDTIEKDPNGTLHKKVQDFVTFVNTPDVGLRVILNDTGGGIAYILID